MGGIFGGQMAKKAYEKGKRSLRAGQPGWVPGKSSEYTGMNPGGPEGNRKRPGKGKRNKNNEVGGARTPLST